jgi:flagellar M-ring protein FliF
MTELATSKLPLKLPRLETLGPITAFTSSVAFRRALPMIGTLAMVALALCVWLALRAPQQRPVFDGLADNDKAAVAAALEAAGIRYSLDRSTGAVSVAEDDLHRARMMLAGEGLPKARPSSDSIIGAIPLGVSRAVETETLRAAREAELARTIEAIEAVAHARVHIALSEPSPFINSNDQSAASVMLRLHAGRTLDRSQVRAISFLVASSVPNLPAKQVSVVDQSGQLLTFATADDGTLLQQSAIEDRIRKGLIALLTPVLGTGGFSAEVHADIDPSESQATRESFPEQDRALKAEESNTTSRVSAGAAVGIPGATSNMAPTASSVTTNPQGSEQAAPGEGIREQRLSRAYEIGREVSVTRQPEGRLRRLSVALVLKQGDKPRNPSELEAVERIVKGAIGFSADRGDQIAVVERPFAQVQDPTTPFYARPDVLPLIRNGMALVGALIAVLLIGLPLRRAIRSSAERAGERAAIETSLLAATTEKAPVTIEMISAAPSYEARANLVREFVRQDPAKASQIVSALISEKADG